MDRDEETILVYGPDNTRTNLPHRHDKFRNWDTVRRILYDGGDSKVTATFLRGEGCGGDDYWLVLLVSVSNFQLCNLSVHSVNLGEGLEHYDIFTWDSPPAQDHDTERPADNMG